MKEKLHFQSEQLSNIGLSLLVCSQDTLKAFRFIDFALCPSLYVVLTVLESFHQSGVVFIRAL